jgi:hypothetical protein
MTIELASEACWKEAEYHATFLWRHGTRPIRRPAELVMTDIPFTKLTDGDRDAILSAITELGNRMDRCFDRVDKRFEQVDVRFERIDMRFEQVEHHPKGIYDDVKVIKADVLELKVATKNLPTYWHMYVALTGLVVTVFSLMRFGMPGH